jgi:hypothetical protein
VELGKRIEDTVASNRAESTARVAVTESQGESPVVERGDESDNLSTTDMNK